MTFSVVTVLHMVCEVLDGVRLRGLTNFGDEDTDQTGGDREREKD